MARLSLSLLGPFQVTLDGRPIADFKSNKVRALLAYLAAEADQPHPREVLAGLLWPDWPDRDALSNLRYTLSGLRRAIGDRSADPPLLLITRDAVQFNLASDYWLDATALAEIAALDTTQPATLDRFQQAAAWYQGGFMEGFSVSDSPPSRNGSWSSGNAWPGRRHRYSVVWQQPTSSATISNRPNAGSGGRSSWSPGTSRPTNN